MFLCLIPNSYCAAIAAGFSGVLKKRLPFSGKTSLTCLFSLKTCNCYLFLKVVYFINNDLILTLIRVPASQAGN